MNIDEAISRLEIFVRDASEVAPELLDDAIKLGIEALSFLRERYNDQFLEMHLPLLRKISREPVSNKAFTHVRETFKRGLKRG